MIGRVRLGKCMSERVGEWSKGAWDQFPAQSDRESDIQRVHEWGGREGLSDGVRDLHCQGHDQLHPIRPFLFHCR